MHRFLSKVISLITIRTLYQMLSTENNDVSPLQQENLSLPVTVNSLEAFTNRTYNNLETNTPKLRHLQRPDVILFWNN